MSSLDKHVPVDAVCLDLNKAFDTAPLPPYEIIAKIKRV